MNNNVKRVKELRIGTHETWVLHLAQFVLWQIISSVGVSVSSDFREETWY